jgi:hypothetical protein
MDMYLECGKNGFKILWRNVLQIADKEGGRNFRDVKTKWKLEARGSHSIDIGLGLYYEVFYSNVILVTAYPDAFFVLFGISKTIPGHRFLHDVPLFVGQLPTSCDPVYCMKIKQASSNNLKIGKIIKKIVSEDVKLISLAQARVQKWSFFGC